MFQNQYWLFRENYIATLCGVIVAGMTSIFLASVGLGIWALMCMTSIEVITATAILWIRIKFKIDFIFDNTIFKEM